MRLDPRCLKITEKVSFYIASEASYVYLSNSVTKYDNFKRTKIGGKCENSKIQMRHF